MKQTKSQLPNRWLVFSVVSLGSICVAISQFKVTGTLSFIMHDYNIDVTTAGLLGSVAAIANLLIALPGGSIVNKVGVRKVWLTCLGLCCIANILGYLAPSYPFLLATRFLEGLSVGFVFIVSPVVITEAFPSEKRGLPMTLWALWTTLGTLVILNLSNVFTPAFGWRSNWLVAAAFLALAFVLNFLFCKVARDQVKAHHTTWHQQHKRLSAQRGAAGSLSSKSKGGWGECLKNPALIGTCVVVLGAAFAFNVYLSYYPLFLQSTKGISPAMANSISTVHTYWMIFLCLTFGFVLNKIPNKHHPKIFFVLTFFSLAGGILMWNMPTIPLDIVAILLCGTGMQLLGPMSHNLAPDTVSPRAVPVAMGMVSFVGGIASLLSPLIPGRIIDLTGNWSFVAIPVGIFTVIGVGASIVVLKKMYTKKTPPQSKVAKSARGVLEIAQDDVVA